VRIAAAVVWAAAAVMCEHFVWQESGEEKSCAACHGSPPADAQSTPAPTQARYIDTLRWSHGTASYLPSACLVSPPLLSPFPCFARLPLRKAEMPLWSCVGRCGGSNLSAPAGNQSKMHIEEFVRQPPRLYIATTVTTTTSPSCLVPPPSLQLAATQPILVHITRPSRGFGSVTNLAIITSSLKKLLHLQR
jgi:hypothetical protein